MMPYTERSAMETRAHVVQSITSAAGLGWPTTPVGWKKWPILWEYTSKNLVTNEWTNDWIERQRGHHIGTMYENGRLAIFKGHVEC